MAKTEKILIDNICPLHDLECEKAVLGTLTSPVLSNGEIPENLTEDCFFDEFNRNIFRAILAIISRGDHPEPIAIKGCLDKMGISFNVAELLKRLDGMTLDFNQYVNRLFDLSVHRKFREIGLYLLKHSASEEEDIELVQTKAVESLSGMFRQSSDNIYTLKDGLTGVHQQVNRNLSGQTSLTGTPTGFEQFDRRSGGLQKSDLIIIAAEQSMGKTSLLMSILRFAALSGTKSIIYSMEMRKEQIASRLASIESGVPANQIMYSQLTSSQLQSFDKGLARLLHLPIYFDDNSTSNIDSIINSIRYMKRKYDIDGAAVDYLQILNVNMKGANKEQQMGDVARRLKNLAKELDIWIIALSQLNRDKDNPIPSIARLRDSGQIAEAADVVMLIYRPEVKGKPYPGDFSHVDTKSTAMIDVAKGRNIGIMKFICKFDAPTTHFYDLQDIPISANVEPDPF